MKGWHYHVCLFMVVGLADCALPDHFSTDHPWRFVVLLTAMALDNWLGYLRGLQVAK